VEIHDTIFLTNSANVEIYTCSFISNIAHSGYNPGGGAIQIANGVLKIYDTTFQSNSAPYKVQML
jgi:hypothetical protein